MDGSDVLAVAGMAALAVLFYTYVVFPLVTLAAAARARKRRVEWGRRHGHSIVLVARNEAHHLPRRLRNLLAQRSDADLLELIVVDDRSTDDTRAVVTAFAHRDRRIRLIEASGRGKASGINDGVRAARGDVIVFCDARQVYERDSIQLLLAPFEDPKVGLTAGSLRLRSAGRRRRPRGFAAGYWALERRLRCAEGWLGMLHGVSGAIYAVRRPLMPVLPTDLILDDMYVPLEVGQQGLRLRYVEAAVAWDARSEDPEDEYVKRRRTLAGNFQLLALRPSLLAFYRNRQLFAFVSHKVLRLATPLFLLLAFGAALWIASPEARSGLLGATGAGLALAGWPRRWLPHGPLGVPMRIARTLLLVNLAILAGLWHVLRGRSHEVWVRTTQADPA